MSEEGGDWTGVCVNILVAIGFAFLVVWAEENPFWATVMVTTFLGFMMVALPLFIFTKSVALRRDMETKQKMKWGIVVGYFIGLFTLISSILFKFVTGLFAVFGVCAFAGIAVIAVARYVYRDWLKENERKRRKALAWEKQDQLEQLKEQLLRGVISQEEYEQKRKLLDKSET